MKRGLSFIMEIQQNEVPSILLQRYYDKLNYVFINPHDVF